MGFIYQGKAIAWTFYFCFERPPMTCARRFLCFIAFFVTVHIPLHVLEAIALIAQGGGGCGRRKGSALSNRSSPSAWHPASYKVGTTEGFSTGKNLPVACYCPPAEPDFSAQTAGHDTLSISLQVRHGRMKAVFFLPYMFTTFAENKSV